MLRRARSTAVAAGIAVLAGSLLAIGPASVASAEPVEGLYTDVMDRYADYDGADSCSPTDKPGAIELKSVLLTAYPGTTAGISRTCGGGSSEHYEGRAVDWMVSAYTQRHLADDFLRWLLAEDAYGNEHAMARRLGVMYIIWNHQMWRAYDADDGWQPYDGPNPHTDHVHISMSWDGALRRTTWFTDADLGMRMDQARFAASWRGPSRLDVFRRDGTGALQQRTWDGQWGAWGGLGGQLTSGPAAVWTRNVLWVFARGENGTLVQRRWKPTSGWDPWEDTGVQIRAAPGVDGLGKRVDVVVVTLASTAAHRSWSPKRGWSDWHDIGGEATSPPAVVWRSPDRLDVFVRGGNARLYQQSNSGGAWAGWADLGGVLTSGPAATSLTPGRADVFVRTNRATVSQRYDSGGGWSPWIDLGGRHVSAPVATVLDPNRLDVFARNRGNEFQQNYYATGTGWSGWAAR